MMGYGSGCFIACLWGLYWLLMWGDPPWIWGQHHFMAKLSSKQEQKCMCMVKGLRKNTLTFTWPWYQGQEKEPWPWYPWASRSDHRIPPNPRPPWRAPPPSSRNPAFCWVTQCLAGAEAVTLLGFSLPINLLCEVCLQCDFMVYLASWMPRYFSEQSCYTCTETTFPAEQKCCIEEPFPA